MTEQGLIVPGNPSALELLESVEDAYSYHVRDFTGWLTKRGETLTKQSVIDYFRHVNESEYTASTKRVKRQAVKKRLRQLASVEGLGSDLSRNLDQFLKDLDSEATTKAPKIANQHVGENKIIGRSDFHRLLSGARSNRQIAFLRFLWATGARVSEMCGVRLSHCSSDEAGVRIRINGKGDKERFVWIPSDLHLFIRETFEGETWLFETSTGKPYHRIYVSSQIEKLGRSILRRKISAHTFRHSFATHMIQDTKQHKAVSEYLGHASTAITLNMYVHEELSHGAILAHAMGH